MPSDCVYVPRRGLDYWNGHTGKEVIKGLKITQEQAERYLKSDLIVHSNNVSKLVKKKLTQNQFDALVSFEYNVGYFAFKNSTMLKHLNSGNHKSAAEQFDRWVHAGGVRLEGLAKRRQAEKIIPEARKSSKI